MALVRKLETGNVLTYEGVGEYEADKLAKTLTLNLDSYVNSLNLSTSDKQLFRLKGASMIKAIREGKVTKNVDGTFSIAGETDLNNTYTDALVQNMKDNGDVNYGALKYEGEYQQSHGIFTSDKTRNFRHENNVLGLVGRWVNETLANTSLKGEEKKEKKSYSFDKAFSKTHLGENDKLLSNWKKVNGKDKRPAAILAALEGADWNTWAASIDNAYGTGEDMKNAILPKMKGYLDAGQIDNARNLAYQFGFSIDDYLSEDVAATNENAADPIKTYWKEREDDIRAKHLWYTEDEVQAALAQEKKEKAAKSPLETQYKEEDANRLLEAINSLPDSVAQPEVFNHAKIDEEHKVVSNEADFRTSIFNINKYFNLWDGHSQINERILNFIDALIDAYGDGSSWEESEPIIKKQYELLGNDSKYPGWVVLPATSGRKYTMIFNPSTGEIKRVHNALLKGTSPYNLYVKDYEAEWRKINERHVTYEKRGGIVKAQGGSKSDWMAEFEAIPVSQKPSKEKNKEASKKADKSLLATLFKEPEVEHGLLYNDETDSEGNPIELDFFYTDESGLDITKNDILRFVGVAGDLISLAGGWADLGGVVSIGTNAFADFNDAAEGKGTYSEALSNLGLNTGLTIAGMIPGLSSLKVAKDIKAISKTSKIIPWAIGTLAAYGAISNALAGVYTNAIDNIIHDRYSSQDIAELTGLGELVMSVLFKKGSMFKGDGPLGGIRQRRLSNQAEHITGVGDKPSITTKSGKNFELTDTELKKIKDAGTSYEAQNEAFLEVQKDRRRALNLPTEAAEGQPAIQYEALKVGDRTGHRTPKQYVKDKYKGTDSRAPKTADLQERHTGSIPKEKISYVDSDGMTRTIEPSRGTRFMADAHIDLFDNWHLPRLGRGEVTGFKNIPEGAVVSSDGNMVTFQGNRYYKNNNGYEIETPDLKSRRTEAEKKKKEAEKKLKQENLNKKVKEGVLQTKNQLIERAKKLSNHFLQLRARSAVDSSKKLQAQRVLNLIEELNLALTNMINPNNPRVTLVGTNTPFIGLNNKEAKKLLKQMFPEKYSKGRNPSNRDVANARMGIFKRGGLIPKMQGGNPIYFANLDDLDKYKELLQLGADFNGQIGDLASYGSKAVNLPGNKVEDLYTTSYNPANTNGYILSTASLSQNASETEGTGAYDDWVKRMRLWYSDDFEDANFWTEKNKKYFENAWTTLAKKLTGRKFFKDGNYTQKQDAGTDMYNYIMGTGDDGRNGGFYDGKFGSMHEYAALRGTQTKNYVYDPTTKKYVENNNFNPSDEYEMQSIVSDDDYNTVTNNFYKKKVANASLSGEDGTGGTTEGGKSNRNGSTMTPDLHTHPEPKLDSNANWANLSEAARASYVAGNNVEAEKTAENVPQGEEGYYHPLEEQTGAYEALKLADNTKAALNLQMAHVGINDASKMLNAQALTTEKGLNAYMLAAAKDFDALRASNRRIIESLDKAKMYNLGAHNRNYERYVQAAKDVANLRANLKIENGKVWSNLWAGINKQLFDGADRLDQNALNYYMQTAADRQRAAYKTLETTLEGLDSSQADYADKVKAANEVYDKAIDDIRYDEAVRNSRILGPGRIFRNYRLSKAKIAKRGSKLTTNDFVLRSSKDFNKRKLEEAREFYKNIRANNKRKK